MVWEALQNLGFFALGTAATGWIVRYGIERFSEVAERGIEQFFDKEIARYESELKNEQVVFSRLHEERATIIIELYERFILFEQDMRALTREWSGDPPTDELFQKATTSGNDFAKYYMENKIYFPPDTCDAVENLQDEMKDVFVDYRDGKTYAHRAERPADVENWLANWREVTEDEVPELKRELENHFRELLGVDLDGGQLEGLDG
ncbi:hypothetical protein OB920_15115 [Halobacteria archaeon HArc-gm2]|nr:hypothetical protein [Halobacteria archaeon HArc-gm2]